jgi:hypothetical protein
MSVSLRTREVRRRPDAIRWVIEVTGEDGHQVIAADATAGGRVFALQSTTGYERPGAELQELIGRHVARTVEQRHVAQLLDEVDLRRWGRVQRPSDRRRWAA